MVIMKLWKTRFIAYRLIAVLKLSCVTPHLLALDLPEGDPLN